MVRHSDNPAATTRDVTPQSLREEWRALLAFLKRPRLPDQPTGPSRSALASIGGLFAIDFALMFLLSLAVMIAIAAGYQMPNNLLDDIELSPGWIAVIVLGAPIAEELIFRMGLSGRLGHLLAVIVTLLAVIALAPLAMLQWETNPTLVIAAALVALGAVVALGWWARGQRPLRWFARIFPAIFWLVALLFGAIHITNYEAAALVMLPLVLPQFVMGLLLGYARVKFGLWSAILLHAMHNGAAVGVMLLGQALGVEI